MLPRSISVLIAALLTQACGSQSRGTSTATSFAVDTAAIESALGRIWQQLGQAEADGDVAAFLEVFHQTARIDGQGGEPLVGQAAIGDKARQSFGARKYHLMDMKPVGTRIWDTTAAYQYGTLVETHTPHGQKTRTEYGRWAGELVRGADGQWRINHLIAFLDSSKVVDR